MPGKLRQSRAPSAGFWQVAGPPPCPWPGPQVWLSTHAGTDCWSLRLGHRSGIRPLHPSSAVGSQDGQRWGPGSPGRAAACWGSVAACARVCSARTSVGQRADVPNQPSQPAAALRAAGAPSTAPLTAGAGRGGFGQRWEGSSSQQTSFPGTGETGGTPGRAWALSHCVRREGHGTGHAGDGRGPAQLQLPGGRRGRREPHSTPSPPGTAGGPRCHPPSRQGEIRR